MREITKERPPSIFPTFRSSDCHPSEKHGVRNNERLPMENIQDVYSMRIREEFQDKRKTEFRTVKR